MLPHIDHPRRENALGAIERGESLRESGHLAADRGLALDHGDLIASVGNVERGLDARHAAANHQCSPRHRNGDRLQGVIVANLGHCHANQLDGLGRGLLPVVMHPRAMLADIGHFDQIGVQALHRGRFAEGPQVHVGRAGSHNDAGQAFLGDLPPHQRLAGIGAHIFVGDRADDARRGADLGRRLLHVDVAGDVIAAPTNKDADPCHDDPPLYCLTTKCRSMPSVRSSRPRAKPTRSER